MTEEITAEQIAAWEMSPTLELTPDEVSSLSYLAATAVRNLDMPKPSALHKCEDYLWARGWCVFSRTPPDQR